MKSTHESASSTLSAWSVSGDSLLSPASASAKCAHAATSSAAPARPLPPMRTYCHTGRRSAASGHEALAMLTPKNTRNGTDTANTKAAAACRTECAS